MKTATIVVLSAVSTLLVAGAVGLAFAWSGTYDIGADAPHTKPVISFLEMARERSISAHSRDLAVPDLTDPQLILKGAGQYAAMCTGCHLAPGMANSEMRPGLYPQPPNFSRERVDPKHAFWAIKHGIKASAMPAWGGSHDDGTMWSMVAFLQKLPDMSAAGYKEMVASAPPDEEMGEGGHQHSHGAGGDNAGMEMHADGDNDTETATSSAKFSKPHTHASGTPPHDDKPSAAPEPEHSVEKQRSDTGHEH